VTFPPEDGSDSDVGGDDDGSAAAKRHSTSADAFGAVEEEAEVPGCGCSSTGTSPGGSVSTVTHETGPPAYADTEETCDADESEATVDWDLGDVYDEDEYEYEYGQKAPSETRPGSRSLVQKIKW
jgi:hypothetical protein